jgi:hypothetical protein
MGLRELELQEEQKHKQNRPTHKKREEGGNDSEKRQLPD